MKEPVEFKSSYFLRILKGDYHPFTPNVITVDDDHIEYRRRNWHMISVDTENLNFHNITGISVDKHIFGATLKIKSTGNDPILVHGYWKKNANKIKDLCSQKISSRSKGNSSKDVSDAISKALSNNNNMSLADELKKLKELVDSGVITQEEFDVQKKKLMSS